MKTGFILFYFFFSLNLLQAQKLGIGLAVNPGISRFSEGDQSDFEGLPTLDSKWKLSGNVGMYLNKPFGRRSSIGFELLLNYVENMDLSTNKLYYFENNNGVFEQVILGQTKQVTQTHLTYAALPIYYQIKSGKVSFRLGVQAQFISQKNYNYSFESTFNGTTSLSKTHDEIARMTKLDFGIKTGFLFHISNRTALRFEYYHALKTVDTDINVFNRSIRQATLGLQYSLTQKKKISEQ